MLGPNLPAYLAAMRVVGLTVEDSTGGAVIITPTRGVSIVTGTSGDWATGVATDHHSGHCWQVSVDVDDPTNTEQVAEAWAEAAATLRAAS